MPPPFTIEEAQRAAREVTRRFGIFECDRCAKAVAKKLGKSSPASFERLHTADQSDIIGLAREDVQVSGNGIHVGVCIGDKVFDNLHHEGVPVAEWVAAFVSATGAPLVRQSVKLEGFFGKVFLTRKFVRWISHR